MKNQDLFRPISYVKAAKYIKNLVDQGIGESFENQIGGVFKAEKLNKWRKKDKFSGYMFWYCIEEGDSKPFIAIERRADNFKYSDSDILSYSPNFPLVHAGGLRVSQDFVIKKFEKSDSLEEEVYNFITSDTGKAEKGFTRKDASKIKKWNENFLTQPKIDGNQKVGFAYFSYSEDNSDPNQKFIDKFFDQGKEDVAYIRYYFGYDTDQPKTDPNKIRLILVPVAEDGRNFEMKDLKEGFLEDGPTLLQYSWPPKPNTI